MIIKSIKLKNFGIHSDAEFDFTMGVNAIVGRNGTGKSTIINAIGIALFNAFTNISDYITYGRDTAKITINFIFKNKSFILAREFGKVSSTVLTGDDLTIKGNKEVYNYLTTVLGIDLKQYFINILRIKSSSITYPFTIEQSKRKLIFDDILNINKYNNIFIYLREPQKELENIIISLEKRINYEKGRLDNRDRYTEEIGKLTILIKELVNKQMRFDYYKGEISNRNSLLRDIDKYKANLSIAESKIAEEEFNKILLDDRKCFTCKSVLNSEDLIELKKFNTEELDKYYKLRDKISTYIKRLDLQVNQIKIPSDIKDYTSEIIKTESRRDFLCDELDLLKKIDLSKLSTEIEINKSKLERLTRIRNGFKVLPQLLSQYSTVDISNYASEIISNLMDSNVRIEFDTTYSTVIEFDDKRLDFNQLSDGQQIMCALAIRLAVNKLFSENIDFLILDEPGISLDETSLGLLEENIKRLGFPQILLISHDTLFSAHADNTIGL